MNEKKAAPTPDQMRALAEDVLERVAADRDGDLDFADRIMTALRAAADQLEAVTPPFSAPQYAKLLREREHLHTMIENAPHGSDTEGRQCELLWREGFRRVNRCTCWKADAL
jgi:hypothetical protein